MADLSKLNVPIGGTATTYNLKDKAVRDTLIEAQTSNKGKVWKTDATTGIPSWQTESGGTTVTPNPSGSATATLSKVGINGTNYDIKDTTYSDATTSASGLMSASDKTKLNGIATGAEVNVQSNWTQTTTTADDYIKNKPNLATVATSGSYNDLSNKPTIPTVPSAYTSNPAMNGTASAGSSGSWSRGDHVHPTDTSRAANISSFTQASSRANIATGETIPTILGKISKWFADLKDLAFIGKDGTSSTKYLRGDGTWQAFPNIPQGTVTSVATGAGLTGGTITGSGTLKAKLKNETQSSLTAANKGSTADREYAVGLDASGNLSVNVPWYVPAIGLTMYNSDTVYAYYYKIYEHTRTGTEDYMYPLEFQGWMGSLDSTYSKPLFYVRFNFSDPENADADGFVTSKSYNFNSDIILTYDSDSDTVRVYFQLPRLGHARVFFRSITPGSIIEQPTAENLYSGTAVARFSDIATLPTRKYTQDVTLSTSDTTTVTFIEDTIMSNSIIDYFCSKWGIVPEDIHLSNGACTIVLPQVSSSQTVKVGIFVR